MGHDICSSLAAAQRCFYPVLEQFLQKTTFKLSNLLHYQFWNSQILSRSLRESLSLDTLADIIINCLPNIEVVPSSCIELLRLYRVMTQ